MFNRKSPESLNPAAPASPFTMEGLEDRRLLSGGPSVSSVAPVAGGGPVASVHYRGSTAAAAPVAVDVNGNPISAADSDVGSGGCIGGGFGIDFGRRGQVGVF